MSSVKEINELIKNLPPKTPQQTISDLRIALSLFQRARDDNESGRPLQVLKTPEEIGYVLANSGSTNTKTAQDLWENALSAAETNIFSDWSGPVLNTVAKLYNTYCKYPTG